MTIDLTFDSSINYAFQQNAIPVIKSLRIHNEGAPQKNLTIRISTEPHFAEPFELRLHSLDENGEYQFASLDLKLNPLFLAGLNERISALLHVEVLGSDESGNSSYIMASRTESISVLAHNEWCGLVSLPEILAAFVLPNDPAVMSVLDRASQILGQHTGRSALNGYQDKNRTRSWEQLAAIYKAIADLGIRYINPPASFENTGQKVRFPTEILAQRFGTCLDLVLLFAACCEQIGLHPLIIMHEGHAYAGCWLDDRTLTEPATDDLQYVRKLDTDELITVFETTFVTNESGGTLADAERLARPHLETVRPFLIALDIKRARIARILPLPIPGVGKPSQGEAFGPAQATPPDSGLGDRKFVDSEGAGSPIGVRVPTRIDQWKSRLLDLSLRNRLLNFKPTKGTIPILSASAEQVEDELSSEVELQIRPRPKLMGEDDPRSAVTYTHQQKVDALFEYLRDELRQKRLCSDLDESEHNRRLLEIYRASRLALEENGTNTLFAAVGILEWREAEHSDRVLRAPLLLVPIQLKRKSVVEGFTLNRIDEETRLNVTVLEMLRQQFEKEIPGLDPLPEDENGVNVAAVFQLFREAIRDMAGWEVKTEIWLSQFSFTKFLLWKDLNDRLDILTRNKIVDHLVNKAGEQYPNPADDIKPAQLDDKYHPSDVFCPRSADSSQLAAVLAAAAGHDFVLEGPPGTGKSQTITNIIAHCLANGKRVLFVAEKRAALDVVHRRLKEDGLEPFCLELHSNKAGKSDVVAQFDKCLRFIGEGEANDWNARASTLEQLRSSLNGYTRALHLRYPCGLSAYRCLDHLLPRQNEPTVKLDRWPQILQMSTEALEGARELSRLLQERSRPLMPLLDHPLTLLHCEDWSPSLSEQISQRIVALEALSQTANKACRILYDRFDTPNHNKSLHALSHLDTLTESLLSPEKVGSGFVTTPWNKIVSELDDWISLTHEREQLRASLTDYDELKLLALDLERLRDEWDSAQHSWVLAKWWRMMDIRRRLDGARLNSGRIDTAKWDVIFRDAMRLRTVNSRFKISEQDGKTYLDKLWNKGEPSADKLSKVRTWGESFHSRIDAFGGEHEGDGVQLRRSIAVLLGEIGGTDSPAQETKLQLSHYRQSFAELTQVFDDFTHQTRLQRDKMSSSIDFFETLDAWLKRLPGALPKLRLWCSWQKARQEGLRLGLDPLIDKLECANEEINDLPELFERSFRHEFFDSILEGESTLRNFFGREHLERIQRFRSVDKVLLDLTRNLVRARLAEGIPRDQVQSDIPKAELGLLRKEIGKRARHIPVRQLLGRIPKLLARLKPCVLMSPLSVAQYLEPSHEIFDVVIFDEASQIPVWDAVGAIARGKQLIVVGDPKQLPPTNFFNIVMDGEDNNDDIGLQQDLESILDELLTTGLRHKRLQWHYRSRHEGLIAFSNRHYYENDLLTFPSPEQSLGGVRFTHMAEARYDKGKSRTNPKEARALVDELVLRLRQIEGPNLSYGVVTFSQAQQQLIENLLDEERRLYPEIEIHFSDDPPVDGEPMFVKNLENVQGDERDIIFFSICYGPDEAGRISINFGPLNRDGGERRLNVAITRAKNEVIVFSSLRGDQIDLTRTRARGVQDLKFFLDYAERGPSALAASTSATADAEPDSEFEQMVANRIRESGFEVHHQVGCSGYRIDLGVVDPQAPGRYLLGIECDGATYHRAATARDRDKLRQLILEGLGWKLYRIWSTDWWHDSNGETEKLLRFLGELGRIT